MTVTTPPLRSVAPLDDSEESFQSAIDREQTPSDKKQIMKIPPSEARKLDVIYLPGEPSF